MLMDWYILVSNVLQPSPVEIQWNNDLDINF